MTLLFILCAIGFLILAFLYNKSPKAGMIIPLLACFVGTILFGGLGYWNKIKMDSSRPDSELRVLSNERQILQGEYLGKVLTADNAGPILYVKDVTSPLAQFVEDGLNKSCEFSVYTGGSEKFASGEFEYSFRVNPGVIGGARKALGGKGVMVFSVPPDPSVLHRAFARKRRPFKVAILNVPSADKDRPIYASVDYLILSKPENERLSEESRTLSSNMEKAFEGDFELVKR